MKPKFDIGLSDQNAPCFTCGVKLSGMQQRIHDLEIELSRAMLEIKRLSKKGNKRQAHRDEEAAKLQTDVFQRKEQA